MEKLIKYVKENKTNSIRCKKCGCVVLKEKEKPTYLYYCPKCNDYKLEIDVQESYMPLTADETLEMLLLLQEIHN